MVVRYGSPTLIKRKRSNQRDQSYIRSPMARSDNHARITGRRSIAPCHVSGQPGAMEHERCLDIFHDNGLENMVKGGTHDLGSTLDLLVTNNPTAVNRIEILPPFSDRNPVFTEIALSAKRAKQKPRSELCRPKRERPGTGSRLR